VMLPVTQFM